MNWQAPGYRESRELGSGASGRVVLAVHTATGTPVAVKYLSDELRADAGFLREFREEARLLGELRTPYVVRFYEYIESPQGAAIVMELVDGLALRALLKQEGATGPEAALVVLKGSLLGLAAAHACGVVHRDYKPENVLVAADGSSKLVDFGIAVRSGSTPDVAGTPLYMAPEQWNGEPASPATDVYAATATFYECLTGQRPYSGETFAELAVKHITAPIPADDVPEAVRNLIRHGMAKAPAERPPTAAVFVEELESVAGAAYGEDWEERGQRKLAALAALLPLLFPSAAGSAGGAAAFAHTVIGSRWLRGRRGLLTGACGLAIVAALTITAVATEGGNSSTASPGATTSASGSVVVQPSESISASPSDASPTPSDSGSPSSTSSSTPSDDPSSSGSTTVAPPAEPPPADDPTPPPAELEVTGLAVSSLQQSGASTAVAGVGVDTSDTGEVSLTVTWYVSQAKGQLGQQDGSRLNQSLSGSTHYSLSPEHTFAVDGSRSCYYWSAVATTSPAAPGTATQQIPTRGCAAR